ncbi:nuclear transport factor 2 family protein [Ottowia thiooxydans]|uniref:Nuclear transport factor 2 family protein n=1 Tax=Ottowia thiooxydans TaxID=219182 RepID=A0ABV2QAT3_9BURK
MAQDGPSHAPPPDSRLGQAALLEFFRRYAHQFNEGLHGRFDENKFSALYSEVFIAAAPDGVVTGSNDADFTRTSGEGFGRYRDVGMKRIELEDVTATGVDPLHALAHTDWNAVYEVDGGERSIRFTNAYLVRLESTGSLKVFGWITGDEEEAMRQHGIGQPQ